MNADATDIEDNSECSRLVVSNNDAVSSSTTETLDWWCRRRRQKPRNGGGAKLSPERVGGKLSFDFDLDEFTQNEVEADVTGTLLYRR